MQPQEATLLIGDQEAVVSERDTVVLDSVSVTLEEIIFR